MKNCYKGNKNIITNIYRVQVYDSVIRGYFCIGFNDLMFVRVSNLLSPTDYEQNDKIILKYFQ